jgi:hypothetical protein
MGRWGDGEIGRWGEISGARRAEITPWISTNPSETPW